MLKIILTALIFAGASVASAQTPEEQQQQQLEVTYKVACATDVEVAADQQLLSIVGDNQDAAKARADFQAFVASPKAVVEGIVTPYNDMLASLEEQLVTTSAAELQTEAEKVVQQNGGTIEEAKKALIATAIENTLAQQQIPPLKALVYQATTESCGILSYIKPEITKTGCKTPAGEDVNMTAATEFCASIAPQMALIGEASGQINMIQQQTQTLIDAVTASINRDAQNQMAPIMESMNTPFEELVKTAMDLIAVPEPIQVPNLPPKEVTPEQTEQEQAPAEETTETPEAPAPGDDVPPPMEDPVVPAQPAVPGQP